MKLLKSSDLKTEIMKLINFTNIEKEVLKNVTNLKTQENLIKDYDVYYLSVKDILREGSKAVLILFLIALTFYKSKIIFILFLPMCFIYPFLTKKDLIDKRKRKLLIEFKDFLRILKTNLEASYSVENSFINSVKELKMIHGENSLMLKELLFMIKRLRLSNPIENVFKEFADKTKIDTIMDFSEVFIIAKRNGGNIAKIISNTINIINDKIEIELDIELKTAEKKFEQNIMNLLPFFIILYMNFTSSSFLLPLYTTFVGRLVMTVALVVYYISYSISKKILDIEV